jgi:hypothetical protein
MAVPADVLHGCGDFFIFIGVTSMLILAMVAWIMLLVLLIMAASQNGNGSFPMIIFIGQPTNCCSHPSDHHYGYYYTSFAIGFNILIGLIVSAVVIGLALHMGLPSIALGLGIGWCAAFAMVLTGLALYAAGDAAETGAYVVYSGNTSSQYSSLLNQEGTYFNNSEPVVATPVYE